MNKTQKSVPSSLITHITLKEGKSAFTYSLRDDLPVFGDGDSDLDKHLEAFQDVCLAVKPKNDRVKPRLFARIVKGTRR